MADAVAEDVDADAVVDGVGHQLDDAVDADALNVDADA